MSIKISQKQKNIEKIKIIDIFNNKILPFISKSKGTNRPNISSIFSIRTREGKIFVRLSVLKESAYSYENREKDKNTIITILHEEGYKHCYAVPPFMAMALCRALFTEFSCVPESFLAQYHVNRDYNMLKRKQRKEAYSQKQLEINKLKFNNIKLIFETDQGIIEIHSNSDKEKVVKNQTSIKDLQVKKRYKKIIKVLISQFK